MTFLLVLLGSIVAVVVLRRPIKACPLLFYALAVVVDVLFICSLYVSLPRFVTMGLFFLIHKCTLALALFTIVMYLGVLPRSSRMRTYLMPIRAELSIVAWILSLGHVGMYLSSYLRLLMVGLSGANAHVLESVVLALMIFALLVVLGVTSFSFVKRRMRARSWKRVQMLAYPFYVLIYPHLLLMLLPAALRGGAAAQVSVAVYSVVFVGYAVLRIGRAVQDRRAHQASGGLTPTEERVA